MDVALAKSHGRGSGHGYFHKTQQGLTLLELLTSLAIVAITFSFGIPKVFAIVHSNRLAAASNSLSGSFALARSEAVTRKREVVICKSRDGARCTKKGGWEQGWIVFIDQNYNEKRDEDEKLVRVQAALPDEIQLNFSAFRSKNFVTYWASGFSEMNGTFTFCIKNQPQMTRALILSKVGRLRKSSTKWDGTPLECD